MSEQGSEAAIAAGLRKQMARTAGRTAARDKWPAEVRTIKKGVMQGFRQLVLPNRRFRIFWRSLKGKGFWVTAKDFPVFYGKTLAEATIKLAETLPEMQ